MKEFTYTEAKEDFDYMINESQLSSVAIVLNKEDGNIYKKDQTYVVVGIRDYIRVNFIKRSLIKMMFKMIYLSKFWGNFIQLLPFVKRSCTYLSDYVQTHLDDVLKECESITILVENERVMSVLMPMELHRMMFQETLINHVKSNKLN